MLFWGKKRENEQDKFTDVILKTHIPKNNKIPILVLDKNWHYMFPPGKKSKKILELERRLNELLKEQGRMTNEERECKDFKKECMGQIMGLMENSDNNEAGAQEDMSKYQKYIEELNDKLEYIENRMYEVPREIKLVNRELLDESVRTCYRDMQREREMIQQLDKEIYSLRTSLRERMQEKNVKEEIVERTYMFLHDLVGVDVVNRLDRESTKNDDDLEDETSQE